MKTRLPIQILILILSSIFSSVSGQEQSFVIRFQNMEQRLFTEKYSTYTMVVQEEEKVISYKANNEKYSWGLDSYTIKKFIDNELVGYIKLDNTRKETHEFLGIIYPYSFISLYSIEEKKKVESRQRKLDSIYESDTTTNKLIGRGQISTQVYDAGVSRWWSVKYGRIMSRASMSQSGDVIYSIQGNVIDGKYRYELFFK